MSHEYGRKKREKKRRTSSPTLIALPPQPGNNTLSPALTAVGKTRPSLFGAPGPTAITVASGSGLDVAEVGRNIPDAVFFEARPSFIFHSSKLGVIERTVSGLKRWTRTRSKRGTRDLIDLNVAWAAAACILLLRDQRMTSREKVVRTMTLYDKEGGLEKKGQTRRILRATYASRSQK
jgi:hypothetical protein